MQTEGDLSPSHIASGFTAQFPDININSEDTLTIVLNSSYGDFYGSDFIPDLLLYGTETNSMLETKIGSFGGASDKMNDNAEMIILFYWDGNPTSPVQDVDYFIWGSYQNAFDKSDLSGYQNDTPIENQLYFEESADEYYSYSRIGTEEIDETQTGGNGITGHDETSENFRESWEVKEIFQMGCTDSDAPNFDPFAEFDDGSCLIPFIDVLNDLYDCNASSNGYCDNTTECPFLNIQGLIVDYFDITPFGGPHSIILEDPIGYQIELTIWPSEWDIVNDSLAFILSPPYNQILIQASGGIFDYNGNKLMRICSSDNILIVDIFGCTDPEACNYDELATDDDGSCEYEYDCTGVCGGNNVPTFQCENLNVVCNPSDCEDDVCSACNIYYTDGYPGFCCDMAWDEGGLTCLYVETEWGLDCGGCNCFGDFAFCEEQGLMMCSDYSCAESLSQCSPECDLGDVNCDGTLNVLDIVIAANIVLAGEYDATADVNEDGALDVLDLVTLVNWVLYGNDETCIDIDGNVYEAVQIGEQLWMAENLKVTHYNNGDEIAYPSNEDFGSLGGGQYGVYDNDPSNADIYGNLYNWAAIVDDRGVCPDGWHVPSDGEFMELEMELGMSELLANSTGYRGTDEGSKLAGSSDLWNDGDLDNNSEFGTSGFNVLPAGYRNGSNGFYFSMGNFGYFWSSSEDNSSYAWYRVLSYNYSSVYRNFNYKPYGFSVRCLGD